MEPNNVRTTSNFFEELENSIGDFIEIETNTGSIRHGKLTGLSCRRIMFNDCATDIIIELEINDDPSDRIPLSELVKIVID